MKNPLYYIGKVLVAGIIKTVDFIDTYTAPGRWWHNRSDQLLVVFIALVLLINVIRAFIAAPIVTGIIVGVVALVIASIYTYSKAKDSA